MNSSHPLLRFSLKYLPHSVVFVPTIMDIEALYLFLGVFVASLGMLVVLKHLFKNKSYEEVAAEHRQQTNAMFSSQSKPKVKDKKQKKAQKKIKGKKPTDTTTDDVGDTSDQTEHSDEVCKQENEPTSESKPNQHVETLIEEVLENKRKPRRESAKPILVKRDPSSEVVKETETVEAPHANHFEESQPKDEVELQSAKEEKITTENKKKKQVDKKSKHQVNETISKKEKDKPEVVPQPPPKEEKNEPNEVKEELISPPIAQNGVAAVPIKDKKKKKSEINILTQNHEKTVNTNMPQLIGLVRKADMSKQEAQELLDVLLNKQIDAPLIVNEWSEGKGDPMQKLKKQLAEKSDLLEEKENALKGHISKLQEVRAEQRAERTQMQQSVRDLQDKNTALQQEKHSFDAQLTALKTKCQKLQDAANEETNKGRQMLEEFKALQMRCQQSDMIVEGLNAQIENKNILIMQYQVDLDNTIKDMELKCQSILATERQQLNNELEMRREQVQTNVMLKNQELQMMEKQLDDAKKQIAKMSSDIRNYQENHAIQLREKENKLAEQLDSYNNVAMQLHKVEDQLKKAHEAKTNGSIEQGKQHQIIIDRLNLEVKNVKNRLDDTEKNYQLKSAEVEELKNKNNKLDAQIAAIPQPEDPNVTRAKFLKRVFPSIVSISPELADEQWDNAVRDAVRNHIVETTAPVVAPASPVKASTNDAEVEKLRSEVATYQKIIDQSESILCKLQTHVEEEQIRWSRELKNKEESISRLSEELELKEEELRQKNDIFMEKNKSSNGVAN